MKVIKVILDIAITGLFICLLLASKTSFVFHEIIAITTLVLVLVHILLNIKQIIAAVKRIFSKKASKKMSWTYVLNTLLLVGILFVAITGILHSRIVFPASGFNPIVVVLHKWSAYSLAALILVHLVLYYKPFIIFVKQTVSELKTPVVQQALASTLLVVIVAGVVNYQFIITKERTIKAAIMNLLSQPAALSGSSTSPSYGSPTSDQANTSSNNAGGSSVSTPDSSGPPTFENYIKGAYCGTCDLFCQLTSPGCWVGIDVLEQHKAAYLRLYG